MNLKIRNMKTKYFALIVLVALFSSCEKFLELKPVSEKPDTDVLNQAKNVQQVLWSAYNAIQHKDFYGNQIYRINELLGDNTNYSVIIGLQDFQNRNFGLFNGPGGEVWLKGYTAIYRANIIINAVDNNLFPASTTEKNNLKGEALFIRALAHFELVRMFAQPYSNAPTTDPGIPIRTFPPTPKQAQEHVARNTVAEVYTQVIQDLKNAATLLDANLGLGRTNKWAATALLSRVYFNMNDFTNAAVNANAVINSGSFSLDLYGPFRNAQAGTIFNIVNLVGSTGDGADLTYLFWNKPTNSPTLFIDTTLYKQLKMYGGNRIGQSFEKLFVDTGSNYIDTISAPGVKSQIAIGYPYSTKFRGLDPVANAPANIPVIRVAEMYLTRAESYAELGNFTDARKDYNAIRAIAGLPDDAATPDAQLRDRIRLERRIELSLENDRYHELRRQKSSNIRGFAYNDKRLPRIPLSEVNGNSDIQQNNY
jgi:hypothetical protein